MEVQDNITLFDNDTAIEKARMYEILATFVPYVVIPLFVLVIGIGFFGNLLVVLVVILNSNMRNTTNLLILNLAVADILFIVFCVPFTAADYLYTSEWFFGDTWCRIVQYLIINTAFVSIYTLVFMAADRFLAVVLPVFSKTIRTVKHTKKVIVFVWMLTMALAVPAFLAHGLIRLDTPQDSYGSNVTLQYSCMYDDNFAMSWVAFQIFFFVLGYFLPLCLIVCLYSVMLYKLLQQGPGGQSSRETMKNKKRVARLVITVSAVFAVSWLPIQCILLLKSLNLYPVTIFNIIFQITSHVLAYSNSCMNPILYAFLSTSFRSEFLHLIRCNRAPRLQANINNARNGTNPGRGTNQANEMNMIVRKKKSLEPEADVKEDLEQEEDAL